MGQTDGRIALFQNPPYGGDITKSSLVVLGLGLETARDQNSMVLVLALEVLVLKHYLGCFRDHQ